MEVTDVQYKESEIGKIPLDWEVRRLSECCKKITDGTHDTPKPVYTGVPFLTAIHVKQNYIDYKNCYFLPKEVHEVIYKRCNPEYGDVLMVNIGAGVATTALIDVDFEFSLKNVALLKPNRNIISGAYLHHYQSYVKQMIADTITSGGAQPFLSLKQIGDLQIALPTKSEQTAIATALSDTDALIENLEKLIAKKRNIKQGVMQELLTGRKRLEGFSTEWRYSTLSKFVADKKFAIVDGPFGSQMKVQDFVEQGIPIVEMEHLKNKFLEPDKLDRYITHKKFEELIRSSVFPDDIIISKTGSLGYISIVPSSIEKALITSRLAKITLDKKKANISFVFQCLARLREIEYWQRTAQGGTMLILSIANISHAPIPDISIYEQKEIADILDTMDNDIERLEQILNKYNMIKQGMMQALLTGKIRLV